MKYKINNFTYKILEKINVIEIILLYHHEDKSPVVNTNSFWTYLFLWSSCDAKLKVGKSDQLHVQKFLFNALTKYNSKPIRIFYWVFSKYCFILSYDSPLISKHEKKINLGGTHEKTNYVWKQFSIRSMHYDLDLGANELYSVHVKGFWL